MRCHARRAHAPSNHASCACAPPRRPPWSAHCLLSTYAAMVLVRYRIASHRSTCTMRAPRIAARRDGRSACHSALRRVHPNLVCARVRLLQQMIKCHRNFLKKTRLLLFVLSTAIPVQLFALLFALRTPLRTHATAPFPSVCAAHRSHHRCIC